MAKSTVLAEIERRSQDLIRVYNPLEKDYIVKWDISSPAGPKLFRVKAKKEEVLIRHIAKKYIKEMVQKIVTSNADESVKKENERRIKSGMAKMDSHTEQPAFETPLLKINDGRYKEIIALLYVGIEREYGIDVEAETIEEKSESGKTAFESALEEVEKSKESQPPLNTVKVEPRTKITDSTPEPEAQPPASEGKYKCQHPGCDFSTNATIALHGHKRTHRKKVENAIKEISK